MLENFKPGTLERLGLGYESLRAVNPDVVMLSTNALGSAGPWSGWLGYGPIVRCVSGIASLWRYPEDELAFGEPTTIYPDHYGARVCATAVLAALIRRRRTARGAYVEVAQAELILNQLADVFLATSLGERHATRARRGASIRAPATTSGASSRCATTRSGGRCGASSAGPAPDSVRHRRRPDRQPRAARPRPERLDADALAARGDGAAAGGGRAGGDDDAPRRPRSRPAPARARARHRAGPAGSRGRPDGAGPVPLARDPAGPHLARSPARRAHARDLRHAARARRSRRSTRCSRPACSRSRCPRRRERWRHEGADRDRRPRPDRDGQGLRAHGHGLRGRGARARARRRRPRARTTSTGC